MPRLRAICPRQSAECRHARHIQWSVFDRCRALQEEEEVAEGAGAVTAESGHFARRELIELVRSAGALTARPRERLHE